MSEQTLSTHCIDRGQGEPTLVFVHGFSCGLSDWEHQVAHFSATHRCIAIDLPGHGGTPPYGEPSIEGCADAAAATMQALGVKAAVWVGHSMGCRVISQVCRDHPDLVCGLVYVDGSFIDGEDPAEVVSRTEARMAGEGFEAFLEQAYRDFHVATTPAAVRDRIDAHRARIIPSFARPLVVDMVRWDVTRGRETLATLAARGTPVMAIQSTVFDANLNRTAIAPGTLSPFSQRVRAALPGATITTIPAGHFPMLEDPAATHRAIAAFLERLA